MKKLAILSLLAICSAFAGDVKNLSTSADMKILKTRFGFETAQDVKIETFRNAEEELAFVDVSWKAPNDKGVLINFKKELIVTEVISNDDQEILYASLPVNMENRGMYERFSVVLTNKISFDSEEPQWSATVRSGFGFCGTMDAVMTLAGDPVIEPIMLIAGK